MSFLAMAWASKQRPSGGPTSKLLLLMLASYADSRGRCFPSAARLADDCGVNRSTIMHHLARLESDALLVRSARFTDSSQRSNEYALPCGDVDDDVSEFRRARVSDKATGVSEIATGGSPVNGQGVSEITTPPVVIRDTDTVSEPITDTSTAKSSALALVSAVPPLPALQQRTGAAIVERLGQVMAEVATGARARFSAEQTRKLQAGIVFAFWMHKFNHPKALLDDKRERIIVKRLEENAGDVSELLYALDGARNDDWVMGTAPNARHANDGVDFILRDRGRVESFANTRAGYKQGKPHALALKYAAVITGEQSAPEQGFDVGGSDVTAHAGQVEQAGGAK